MSDPISQIVDLVQRSNKILILPSCPPDGDSIGSALALFEGLRKLNKKVTVVCADPVPDSLTFLQDSGIIADAIKDSRDFIVTLDCGEAQIDKLKYEIVDNKVNIIITPKNGEFSEKHVSFKRSGPDYDLVIAVDTADVRQLGKVFEDNAEFFYEIPLINIDHHISNSSFGKVNYVDTAASSTTEILVTILKQIEEKEGKQVIDSKVATYLLTGILTDTGSYQNPNTTPKSLEVSAELVERGAAQQEIIKHVFRTKNLSTLKLWGEILSKIETDSKHRIVWSTMTKGDLAKTNAKRDEVSGLIDDMLVNAPGAEIVFIVKEDEDKISCSLRSTTPAANVSEIAEHFSGGGHVQAAGFRIPGAAFQSALQEIINYIKQYQAKRLNLETESKETANYYTTPVKSEMQKPLETKKDSTINYVRNVNEKLLNANLVEKKGGLFESKPSAPPKQNIVTQKTPEKVTAFKPSAPPQSGPKEERKPAFSPRPVPPPMPKREPPRQKFEPRIPRPQPKPQPQPQPQPQPKTQAPPIKPPAGPKEAPVAKPEVKVQNPFAPQIQPIPKTPAPQPQMAPVAPKAPIAAEPVQPKKEEPSKPVYDPFNPPSPSESDILAALSKL